MNEHHREKTGFSHSSCFFSIGIPASEYEGRVNPNDRQHRLEAIHVRGFDGRKIKSDDIYAYFKEHDLAPVSFEWVDANSANVIWALGSSSAKALLTLSRPIVVPHRNEDEASMEDDDMVLVRKADEYNSDKENSDDDDGTLDENQRRVEAEKRKERKIREKLLPKVRLLSFKRWETSSLFILFFFNFQV